MYVSLMYRLWKILLSNMLRSETFGMTLVQTINCNVGLKCFLFIYQNVCLLLSLYMHFLHIVFLFLKIV